MPTTNFRPSQGVGINSVSIIKSFRFHLLNTIIFCHASEKQNHAYMWQSHFCTTSFCRTTDGPNDFPAAVNVGYVKRLLAFRPIDWFK